MVGLDTISNNSACLVTLFWPKDFRSCALSNAYFSPSDTSLRMTCLTLEITLGGSTSQMWLYFVASEVILGRWLLKEHSIWANQSSGSSVQKAGSLMV